MTTVNNQKELKAALDKGERFIKAGNKRMESALSLIATWKGSVIEKVADKGVLGITAETILAIGIAVAITCVGIAVLLNRRGAVVLKRTVDGDIVFEIRTEKES